MKHFIIRTRQFTPDDAPVHYLYLYERKLRQYLRSVGDAEEGTIVFLSLWKNTPRKYYCMVVAEKHKTFVKAVWLDKKFNVLLNKKGMFHYSKVKNTTRGFFSEL